MWVMYSAWCTLGLRIYLCRPLPLTPTHTPTASLSHLVLQAIVALPTSKPVSADILVRAASRCVQVMETETVNRRVGAHLKVILAVLQHRKDLARDVACSQGEPQSCMFMCA